MGIEPPEMDDDKLHEGEEEVGVEVRVLTPIRMALFFTGHDPADDSLSLEGLLVEVIEYAEQRGLFFEWAATDPMEDKDVVVGSPLWKAVYGEDEDDDE